MTTPDEQQQLAGLYAAALSLLLAGLTGDGLSHEIDRIINVGGPQSGLPP